MKEKQDRAIAENSYCEGMYCFRPNAKSVHHFKAHPLLTLELSKDSLAEFSDRSYSGITYRKGLLPMKGEDGSVLFDSTSDGSDPRHFQYSFTGLASYEFTGHGLGLCEAILSFIL